ncbi:MAG TPA: phage integrase N-terminal SAM-like domain-containing protein [Acidobacteriota bacterium]|nr:phage integrase N-terminal SAM-like domain-containing protein [Acidobacteriota bacterium]
MCESAAPGTQKPKLLDRLRREISRRNYSRKTEKSYIGWIRRLIIFHGKRHLAGMASPEVSGFLRCRPEPTVKSSTGSSASGLKPLIPGSGQKSACPLSQIEKPMPKAGSRQ